MAGTLRTWLAGLTLVVACKAPTSAPGPSARPPAGSTVEVARFTLSLSPRQGRLRLRRAPSPRAAYTYAGTPLAWEACADETCTLAAGQAGLWTDPQGVLFHDFDGTCYSNEGVVACPVDPPCNTPGMFCAPLLAVSSLAGADGRGFLPDVIVQLAPGDLRGNDVLGCKDDIDWTGGLCVGSGKVDAPTSNLTSPIPGDPDASEPTFGCSYCYGNPSRAREAGWPGLEHGLLSGHEPALRQVNTAMIAMRLATAEDYDVTLSIRHARPAADELELADGATCARGGLTRVVVRGGGFGPPGDCLGEALESCPLVGPPAPGYRMLFDRIGGGSVEASEVSWSDGEVSGLVPSSARAGTVRVVTPQAPEGAGTSEVFARCLNAEAAFVAGATPALSGGGVNARLEVGRGLRPTTATGVDPQGKAITMTIGRGVAP